MEIAIILIVIAAGAIFFFKNRKDKKPVTDPNHPRYDTQSDEVEGLTVKGVKKKFPFYYTTPNGVNVGSVIDLSGMFSGLIFKAIEYGILNQIRATTAKFPHWTKAKNLNEYLILFVEPHTFNMDSTPALLVNGQYQTAGTVIGLNDSYPVMAIVLPHQGKADWRFLLYLLYSVWNESEHLAEIVNDMAIASIYFGGADAHPHHPLPEGVAPLLIEETQTAVGFFRLAPKAECCFPSPKPQIKSLVSQSIYVPKELVK